MNFIKTSTLTSCLVLFLSVALLIGCKPIFEKKPIPSKDDQAAAATAPSSALEPEPEPEPAALATPEPTEIEDVQSLQSMDSAESDIDAVGIDIENNEAPAPIADDGDDIVKPDTAMIRDIQQALVNAGFNPGPVDGKSGGKTTAAIEAFQKENGIVPGKIDKRTLRALGVEF
ncbi:peptidoglycan-binding domain-containing protein [Nitrosomonas ureae]|uniref:Peptidoglycan binding domain-containing protein n=1 Tax=Nitrosomonas ureae TaxID=44577 RepID=A0A1H2DR81_9PROT|nr:peptidoglycan-binding domain-containing protein [Nitrosomonas ureae]ALQ50183.1 peptidoglycan-binding protein [Nitrosomonas ureae]SDT85271.1 Putative peptidoglycan binding domain-containing protein [Nitrosomonas ureae]